MKPGVKGVTASGQVTPSNNGHTEDEPPKDPGSRTIHQPYTEQDFEGTIIFFFLCLNYFN